MAKAPNPSDLPREDNPTVKEALRLLRYWSMPSRSPSPSASKEVVKKFRLAIESLRSERDSLEQQLHHAHAAVAVQDSDNPVIAALTERAERAEGPHWVCSICGYHPDNKAWWCASGCGRDFNRMHKVDLADQQEGE